MELWATILQAAPTAHLIIYARAGKYLDDTRRFFHDAGIDPRRIRFVGRTSQAPEYFRRYHEIDIGLDPFPYSGGITSIDSLWMGVPMVTLRGKTAVGRGGVSVLSNAGLADWIADAAESYAQIALQKSQELQQLSELRAALRGKIKNSPLMDTHAFARDMENAYREMWRSGTPR
jgi:predicted O-linked N-acetylglucosamine transferase (SPINDLY family)